MTSLEPFISRDDLADHLKLADSALASDQAALQAVDAACDMVRTLTEQDFNRGTTTLTMDGTGTDTLLLPQLPVASVGGTIVESGGTLLAANDDYTLGDDGVVYRLPGVITNGWGDSITRTFWWPGRRNIEVSYTHGYDDADLPRDIRMVALQIAERLYKQSAGVVFEQLGQRQIRWDTSASDLTSTERIVLEKYKQKR